MSSAWVLTNEVRYVYDGNLVIQERNGNNLPTVTYTRGKDLSGTMEGAGGIGGMLARTDNGLLTSGSYLLATALYHADGNGNIMALVATNGLLLGRYHYDPYGNLLAVNGQAAQANLYRFSSKEWHPNSGLVYYLYRFYDAGLQRWVNRDPSEESGGINLFTYVANSPQDKVDPLGLGTKDGHHDGCDPGMHCDGIVETQKGLDSEHPRYRCNGKCVKDTPPPRPPPPPPPPPRRRPPPQVPPKPPYHPAPYIWHPPVYHPPVYHPPRCVNGRLIPGDTQGAYWEPGYWEYPNA